MNFDAKEMGKRVKNIRLRMGYTQEKFAEKLNVDRSYVGKIERGEKSASVELVVLISESFDVTTDYLLKGNLNTPKVTREEILTMIEKLESFANSL